MDFFQIRVVNHNFSFAANTGGKNLTFFHKKIETKIQILVFLLEN